MLLVNVSLYFTVYFSLQASTELIRDHTEGYERENAILKKELDILVKRLVNIKESKRTKLRDIKVLFLG